MSILLNTTTLLLLGFHLDKLVFAIEHKVDNLRLSFLIFLFFNIVFLFFGILERFIVILADWREFLYVRVVFNDLKPSATVVVIDKLHINLLFTQDDCILFADHGR